MSVLLDGVRGTESNYSFQNKKSGVFETPLFFMRSLLPEKN